MPAPARLYAFVSICVVWHALASQSMAWLEGAENAAASPSNATSLRIPDFSVAISSVKFPGEMDWSYDRNVQAALAAASASGPLTVPNFTTESSLY
jgi:hypothetical protein